MKLEIKHLQSRMSENEKIKRTVEKYQKVVNHLMDTNGMREKHVGFDLPVFVVLKQLFKNTLKIQYYLAI